MTVPPVTVPPVTVPPVTPAVAPPVIAPPLIAKRPEPPLSSVATLCVLFLVACVAYGTESAYPEFGRAVYNTNVILAPPTPHMQRMLGPMEVTDDDMQLVFFATHPRPADMPDLFVFDWRLEAPDGVIGAVGRVGYDGERFREDPQDPHAAVVPLEAIHGNYMLVIEPKGMGDFPDMIILLTHTSAVRPVAWVLSWLFGAMFLALAVVVTLRQRAAVAAWSRLQPRPTDPPSEAPAT